MTFLYPNDSTTSQSKTTVEAVLTAYFDTINHENFESTAALFAEQGVLYPPFGRPVTGREAIAAYLACEAKGMTLCPSLEGLQPAIPTDDAKEPQTILVSGQVQTSLFTVNIGWSFDFNASCEIQSVQVKLLAGLEELLQLKTTLNRSGVDLE